MKMNNKRIFFRPERCLHCLSCVLSCQIHSLGQKQFSPGKTPPRKIRLTFAGGTPWVWKCRHCTAAPCVEACISGSLRPGESGRGMVYDPERCVGCGSCALACPLGVPAHDPEAARFLRCDLCPGEEPPPCVRACRSRALVFEDVSRFVRGRKKRFVLKEKGFHESD